MSYWTDDDIRILRNMSGGKASKAVIAATLGRSQRAVKGKAAELGISLRRSWFPREEDFLRQNIGFLSLREIGRRLGRDEASVRRKATVLSLDGPPKPEPEHEPETNRGGGVASTATGSDEEYVFRCVQAGGFPVVVVLNGKTVWVTLRRAA